MTSRDESRALTNLYELLARDLSKVDLDELVTGAKDAEQTRAAAMEWTGRLLAELSRRGKSWPQIARLTGIPQATAYRRAAPFLGNG